MIPFANVQNWTLALTTRQPAYGPELAFALGRFAPTAIALVVNCETRKRSFVVGTDCSSSLSPETIKTIGLGRCEIERKLDAPGVIHLSICAIQPQNPP